MFFQFSIRHLEFRKYLESENVGDGTVESGIVENRGVAVGISFLCGLELEIWVGVILPPLAIIRCKITLDKAGLRYLLFRTGQTPAPILAVPK